MKTTTLIPAIILSLAFTGDIRAEADWETLPVAPRDDETSEWWANTWHPGDVVPMVSRYQFEGRFAFGRETKKKSAGGSFQSVFLKPKWPFVSMVSRAARRRSLTPQNRKTPIQTRCGQLS